MFWVWQSCRLFKRMILRRKNDEYLNLPTFNHLFLFKNRTYFFAELGMSRRWAALLFAMGVWGVKPTWYVRVEFYPISISKFQKNEIFIKWLNRLK